MGKIKIITSLGGGILTGGGSIAGIAVPLALKSEDTGKSPQQLLNEEQTRINGLKSTSSVTTNDKDVAPGSALTTTIALAYGITLNTAEHAFFTYTYQTSNAGITITAHIPSGALAVPAPFEIKVSFSSLTDAEILANAKLMFDHYSVDGNGKTIPESIKADSEMPSTGLPSLPSLPNGVTAIYKFGALDVNTKLLTIKVELTKGSGTTPILTQFTITNMITEEQDAVNKTKVKDINKALKAASPYDRTTVLDNGTRGGNR